MKRFLLLFLCLITLTNLKPNTIQGKIKDNTNEELTGVKIVLFGNGIYKTIYTDFNGEYKLDGVIPGTYIISYYYLSYKSIKTSLILDNDKTLNLKMEKI